MNNSLLISVPSAAKKLGVPKKAVLSMINTGVLVGIAAAGDTYITTQSIESLAGQNSTVDSGQHPSGYPEPQEVSCLLTKNDVVVEPEKVGADMVYKGSVSSLKDGRFMVQIDLGKTPDGKRKRESKSFKSQKEADAYLAKRLQELNGVQVVSTPFVPAQPMASLALSQYTQLTFEEYAIELLNSGVGKATTRTIENYRRGSKMMLPYIGSKKMVEITEQDIKKAFEKIRYAYAKSGVRHSFNTTKLIFQTALDNNDIPVDIMRRLRCPTSKKPVAKDKYPTFSDEDIDVLFQTSRKYSLELYTIFAVLECTGMRPGELRALEWDSFDPLQKTIRIQQAATVQYEEITTLKRQAKHRDIISTPKSEYSVRTLRLSDLAVKALQEWKQFVSRSRSAGKRNSQFIFSDKVGNVRSESSYQSLIQRYRKQYHIEDMGINLYKFRHTMCTRLILSGQPISVIQRIMGDNTPDIIMKIYTHVNEEMAMKATEGFYDELNRKNANRMVV